MPVNLIAGVFLFLGLGLFFVKTNIAQAGIADHLVINEIQIDSLIGSGGSEDDWVELFNPTDQAINLNGWSIQKVNSFGGSFYKQALTGSIPAKGYFLIVRGGTGTAQALKDKADVLANNSFLLTTDYTVYLVNNNENIVPGSISSNIVDLVGFGNTAYFESSPEPFFPEEKSIARMPDGEDTNNNAVDFFVQDSPSPQNSHDADSEIGGTVLLTVTSDIIQAENIAPTEVKIVFQVNANGTARINYGLTAAYGSATVDEAVTENVAKTISLTGLTCATTYHYSIHAADTAVGTDDTADATFTTLPCGITINTLSMIRTVAKANNKYVDGWEWEFNITVWDMAETDLKMKFDQWSGVALLNAGANMQFSVNNGVDWLDISANGVYPALAADISTIDTGTETGRQVKVMVRMKVPIGTKTGNYNSNYGILTE